MPAFAFALTPPHTRTRTRARASLHRVRLPALRSRSQKSRHSSQTSRSVAPAPVLELSPVYTWVPVRASNTRRTRDGPPVCGRPVGFSTQKCPHSRRRRRRQRRQQQPWLRGASSSSGGAASLRTTTQLYMSDGFDWTALIGAWGCRRRRSGLHDSGLGAYGGPG